METKKWLQDNNLPVTTDIETMYAYLDEEIEKIRLVNKRNGKKLRRIDNAKLVKQWVEIQTNELRYKNTGRIRRSLLPSPGVGGVGNFVFREVEPTVVKTDEGLLNFSPEIKGVGKYKIDRNANRRVLSSGELTFSEEEISTVESKISDSIEGVFVQEVVVSGQDEEHSVGPLVRTKFAGSDSDLTRRIFELGEETEKVNESWANEILYVLIGVAGFLMIVFLALLIYNQRVAKIRF